MWRSVASKSRASLSAAARGYLASTQNPKVLESKTLTLAAHFRQNTRYFSQVSEKVSDFCESDDAQMVNFAPGSVSEGSSQIGDNVNIGAFGLDEENGDTQVPDETQLVEEVNEIDLEQLESLLALLQSSGDGSLESGFRGLELSLHQEFVAKLLETPIVVGGNLIRFVKWALKEKPEFRVTTQVLDALVLGTCREIVGNEDVYALWDLVKDIGGKEDDLFSADILNVLISSFSKLREGKAALEVFDKFVDFGCVPNVDTYYITIEALCRCASFDSAKTVSEKMVDAGILPDAQKVGRMVSWFCKAGSAKDVYPVYLLLKEEKQCLPHSSAKHLISSLCKEDETVKLALDMLEDYTGESRKYAIEPFSAIVRGLCRTKDVDGAKKLLLEMTKEGPPPGHAVFNLVINAYSKAGDMGEAIDMLKLMESRGLKPDVFTYTVIMSGYANGGQMEEACNIYSEAKKKHDKLTPVTYHTLISNFCKLEEFDKALELFHEMKDYGVQPNADQYNKLIQSLCMKALDWKTSEKLLEEMKGSGLHLSEMTRGLIRAVKELQNEKIDTEKITA